MTSGENARVIIRLRVSGPSILTGQNVPPAMRVPIIPAYAALEGGNANRTRGLGVETTRWIDPAMQVARALSSSYEFDTPLCATAGKCGCDCTWEKNASKRSAILD